ncbi:hypothetical protein [uncultured Selenomonas sp.]|uniref:hypothetical protein n=1 Tax=uncultured Selenomonas sp. TaxID=159275 RepID=UPI0025F3083C|nr:hypothetical protein [uncultured Selenomonas sp.]
MSNQKGFWALVLLGAAILVSLPDLAPHHIYAGGDIEFHLYRIEGIKNGLLAGEFPVRLNAVNLNGYGMPTGIFYPDLFLYFPAVLRLAGLSLVASWKSFLVATNIVTAFASWWAFSSYLRSARTGAVASLFYLVFLYRVFDIYVRNAAGEILALAFLPAALLSVWMMLRRRAAYWPAVVLFGTCILQSHVLTSLLLVGASVIMLLVSLTRLRMPDVRWAIGKAAFFLCLLNVWFYAPLLWYHQNLDYYMKLVKYVDPTQQVLGLRDADFYMGTPMLLLLLAVTGWRLWRRRGWLPGAFWTWLGLSAFVIAAMSVVWPWQWLGGVADTIQFPFRLAVLPAVFLPMALAVGLEPVRRSWVILLCVIICFVGNFYWSKGHAYAIPPQHRQVWWVTYQLSTEDFMSQWDATGRKGTGLMDYLDMKAVEHERARSGNDAAQIFQGLQQQWADTAIEPAERIQGIERAGSTIRLAAVAGEPVWTRLPVYWYAGYTARSATGAELPLRQEDDGRLSVQLPEEAGTVTVRYEGLPWFRLTDMASCLALCGFLLAWKRQGAGR